jgi:hypothetical protein
VPALELDEGSFEVARLYDARETKLAAQHGSKTGPEHFMVIGHENRWPRASSRTALHLHLHNASWDVR